jgi:hypothetical protein
MTMILVLSLPPSQSGFSSAIPLVCTQPDSNTVIVSSINIVLTNEALINLMVFLLKISSSDEDTTVLP